jgi:hypothetical protein
MLKTMQRKSVNLMTGWMLGKLNLDGAVSDISSRPSALPSGYSQRLNANFSAAPATKASEVSGMTTI